MSAQSQVTSRCDVAHSGRENLHHFLAAAVALDAPVVAVKSRHMKKDEHACFLNLFCYMGQSK